MTPELWQRVEATLDAIEEAPVERRGEVLERLCVGDDALRREVERLLDVATEAEGFLDAPIWSPATTPLPAPEHFGPYRVEASIGRGGMGEVFLARRADGEFDQQVAVKLLDARSDDHQRVRRFRHERQILAGLDHPNIARLIDGGTVEDGRPYLVMEHVEGEPIVAWCRRHGLGVEARLRLVLKVCAAVQAAHQRLIVHRDLKPSNILVDAAGEPKLLDFGIATVLGSGEHGADASGDGSADHRFMTPAYASPEQVRGDAVTTATDVHALGVLLYELLTEQHPFLDGDPSDPTAVTDRIDRQAAPRPSGIAEADRGRRLRGDLDAIIDKALRKEPAERYASAAQLADDLRRHLEHRPVLARRPTLAYLGGRLVRRHRLGSALAALLLVVILGSVGLALHLWRQAVSEQARAEEVAEFLEDLYQLPDPRRDEGATITALELLQRSADSLGRELEDQPADRAALLLAIGSAYRGLGQHEPAARFLRRGLDLQAATGHGMDRRRLAGLLDLAAVERARGREHSAETAFDAASVALEAGGVDHPRLARHLNNHASLLDWEGRFRAAETLHRQALAMKERLLGRDHEDVATGCNNLATTLLQQGKLDEAERFYRRALAARLTLHGAESPRTLSTHNNLAVVLRDRGEWVEAEAMLRENLDARQRRLGESHPALGTVLNNLAMCRQAAGDPVEAAALYDRVQGLFDNAYGPDHVNAAIVRRNRSALALAEGEAQAAEELARAAVETFREQLGGEHWRVADAESLLGASLAAQGAQATAIDGLRRAVRRLEATKGPAARETSEARERLARWTLVAGEEG